MRNDAAIQALAEGRHGDPFAILGAHDGPGGKTVLTFQPGAKLSLIHI